MRSSVVAVTPQQARKWLERLFPNQRSVRRSTVKAYAEQMRRGNWMLQPDGISIGTDGTLLNGQHRLLAVCAADCPVEMYVTTGVPLSAYPAIDGGSPRSMSDRLGRGDVDSWMTSVVRAVVLGRSQHTGEDHLVRDVTEMGLLVDLMWSALDFVSTRRPRGTLKRYFPSTVCAVFVRAYYHAKPDRLAEAVSLLREGTPPDGVPVDAGDRSIITLREWISRSAAASSSSRRAEMYAKTSRALRAFLDREPIIKLYEVREELFPLPEFLGLSARGDEVSE